MPSTRFALATGGLPLDAVVAAARDAERLGYEAVLVGEAGLEVDALVACAAVLQATRRVRCGPGIATVYDRHPVALARGAATLDRLAPGRALLGLGRGARPFVERGLGLGWEPSQAALRDALAICRPLLSGTAVAHRGSRWSAEIGPAPERSRAVGPVPLLLAAVGPRTLRLAGASADGVLLNYGAPPDYVRWAVGEVRAGALDAGRDPEAVDVYGYLFVLCTDGVEQVESRLDSLRTELETLHAEPGQGRWLAAQAGTPERWDDAALRRFAVVGSRDECLARIEAYRDAGLRCPVVMPSAMRSLHGPSRPAGSRADPLL
jgi:alkanesulfonate monooxygenase SsuD/methylene tetrahydromethanopterin reductase-like flavin-dependent oxidoreductase (luciferase family)